MLDEHTKRELRQLWFGASQYLELARELDELLGAEVDHTTAAIANTFVNGVPNREAPEYKLAVFGAHIASAGIRLGSIHEVLSPDKVKRCRNLLKMRNTHEITKRLDDALNNCVCTLLRDNVAHVDGGQHLGVQRESYLAGKTYRQLYEAVLQDAANTANQLRTEGVLE